MKSFLVRNVLRLLGFLVSSQAISETEMVQIVHPDLELYFLEMLRTEGVSKETEFLKMDKEEKRQICLSSVQSSLFYASDDNRSNWTPTRFHVRTGIEEIERWYDTSIPDAVRYYSVAASVKSVVLRVNAHRCRSTPEMKMFVTHGDQPGTYIILGKDHEDYYTIRGLLLPVPEITSITYSTDAFALSKYLKNKLSEMAKRRKSSFCDLTQLQKVRLCSTVYIAYQKYRGEKIKHTNAVHMDVCVKEALIELETEDSVAATVMDLIECTFTQTSSVSNFYLGDDVTSESSAFVLHRMDDGSKASLERRPSRDKTVGLNSSYEITFRPVLHVQKPTGLSN